MTAFYRRLSLCLFFLSAHFYLQAQTGAWITQLNYGTTSKKTLTDAAGNVYELGGGYNIRLLKYNAAGGLRWSRLLSIGSAPNADMDFDQNGNLIIGGSFSNSADFDPGAGVTTLTPAGSTDIFVAKFDTAGIFQWVKQIGGAGSDDCLNIATDRQNNIILSGNIDNTVDFDPGAGVYNSTGNQRDLFICRLTNAGNFVSVARIGQALTYKVIHPADMSVDAANNIVLAGDFAAYQDSIDFDPGPTTFYLAPKSARELFVLKLDGSMNFKWARRTGSPNVNSYENYIYSMKTDRSGNVYFTGRFYGTIDTDPGAGEILLTASGTYDMFIEKWTAAGNYGFSARAGSVTSLTSGECLALDSSANVFVSGFYSGTVDFDPGIGTANLTAGSSSQDAFVLKLTPIGNYVSVKPIYGTGSEIGQQITLDLYNNILLSGPFDASLSADNVYTFASVNPDHFMMKLADGNNILGTLFSDANNNGTLNSGEFLLRGVNVKAVSSSKTFYAVSDSFGRYNLSVEPGNYTVSPISPPYFNGAIPASYAENFTNIRGRVDTAKSFGLVPMPGKNDLQVKITNISAARPGFQMICRLTYKNVGTTLLSGNINFSIAQQQSFLSAVPAAASISNGMITHSVTDLAPTVSGSIDYVFLIPSATPAGTVLRNIAVINGSAVDETPADNTDTLKTLVTASFDPNDKSVIPANSISPAFVAGGNYLDYTVRFQNTGTDTAFNINIIDSLSSNLDQSTFQMISASHNYSVSLKNNNYLEWQFPSILLPDSNHNEPLSHGFVRYRIKPKTTLVTGDQIKNRSYIGFDFNSYVITNQTLTPVFDNSETTLCPPAASSILSAGLSGTTYQWQVNKGAGFVNIANGGFYSGVGTQTLQLISIPSSFYGYIYRCLVNGNAGRPYTIRFAVTWTGVVNNAWETAGNWSCNAVPDANTDVVLPAGANPLLNTMTSVRSLKTDNGGNFTATPQAILILTGIN